MFPFVIVRKIVITNYFKILSFEQIDQLKLELSKKESELLALQTKLETLGNQNSDCKQHIEVLKESLTAKEQRAAILQTEVRLFADCSALINHVLYCESAVTYSDRLSNCFFIGFYYEKKTEMTIRPNGITLQSGT